MNLLAKIISTTIKSGRRLIKFNGFGKDDIRQVAEALPYGTDSNPIKGMVALCVPSAENGKNVIVGYLNTQQLADIGEHRTYSTDAEGALKFYIWQKNDGTCEIGGNTDWMVRYTELEAAFNEFKQDFNNFVSAYNAHTHSYNPGPGAAAPTLVTTSTGQPTAADISGAKIEEIKTIGA